MWLLSPPLVMKVGKPPSVSPILSFLYVSSPTRLPRLPRLLVRCVMQLTTEMMLPRLRCGRDTVLNAQAHGLLVLTRATAAVLPVWLWSATGIRATSALLAHGAKLIGHLAV